MIDFETCRRNMVDNQLRPNGVVDRRVLAAMGAVPREQFVDERHRGVAYVDEDIPLGDGRWLIEPQVLARLLQAAEIGPDDVVLDIGCGSGYTAAVCAGIATTVVAVESDPRFTAEATRLMGELDCDNVVVVEAPLAEGYPDQAPYDVIIFSGAIPELPPDILGQLGDDGRLAAVVSGGNGAGKAVVARNCGGIVSKRVMFDAWVPPLPGFERDPEFVF